MQKWNQKKVPIFIIDSSKLPIDTVAKVILIASSLLTPVAQMCAGAIMAYSQAERVFVLEDYLSSKSIAAVDVCVAVSGAF
jgi:hypothetical protein